MGFNKVLAVLAQQPNNLTSSATTSPTPALWALKQSRAEFADMFAAQLLCNWR